MFRFKQNILFVPFICSTVDVGGSPLVNYPDSCPMYCDDWQRRTMIFECPDQTTYHCIMEKDDRPIETCMGREKIEAGEGCPWVSYDDRSKTLVLGFPRTHCPIQEYCPGPNLKEYYTDQLCKFPACLVRENKRENFKLPIKYIPSKMGPLFAFIIIPFLGILVLMVIYIRRRKACHKG